MHPPCRNGTLQQVIARCRACREPCERYLAQVDPKRGYPQSFSDTLRCVALLTMIAERLEADDHCPAELIEATIDLARELRADDFGCAAACEAAADTLAAWLEGGA